MRYVPASEWKQLPPRGEYPNGVPVDVVYVHHDTAPLLADPLATVRQHQRDHIVSKGWNDIAYQEWVANNGDVYEGRGFRVRDGATGCQGGESLSICLQGNFENVVPTRAQLDSLVTRIVAAARQGLLTPGFKILAHQDAPPCPASWTPNTNATACCGKHLIAELPAVRARVAAALTTPEPEEVDEMKWLYYHDESNGTEFVVTNSGDVRFYGPAALKQLRAEGVIPSAPKRISAAAARDFRAGDR